MANDEHVAILKQGVDVWNKWRAENWAIKPDLSGADLQRENLNNALTFFGEPPKSTCGADLQRANLNNADLSGANLTDADLRQASLNNADLSGADLTGADLSDADLTGADLSGANLRRASLNNADLSGTDLQRADLTGADLRGANLNNTDLRGANLTIAYFSAEDLTGANLTGANLTDVVLTRVDLTSANLTDACLRRADLRRADLTDAYLTRVDLTSAYLTGANLTRANLIAAHLIAAYLASANLTFADLTFADLTGADLSDADLSGVNLTDADLTGANLTLANLNNADLVETNLTETKLGWTTFAEVVLTQVKGLETVAHHGPSTIGVDTIYNSGGNIPEVFLRGAGVPDNFITFMKSLTGQAFDFYSCFICHSSKDREFVERLYADLQSNGVRCWYAPEDLKIGEPFLLGIDQGIRLHDKLLLVLSENSVGSGWVQHEVLSAMAKENGKAPWVLFPIRLDNAVMETDVSWANMIRHQSRHIGDFTRWKDHDSYKKAFDKLLSNLKGKA